MDNFDIIKENFIKKLDALLEERYPNESRQQARRNKFVEDYEKRFEPSGSFKGTLNNWIYRKSVPELRTLLNICELLNAEPNYFLVPSQTEFRKGAQSASELLGLPESVTNAISQYDTPARSALCMLASSEYGDLLEYLLTIIFDFASDAYGLEITIKNRAMLDRHLLHSDAAEVFQQLTADKIKMVLNSIAKSYNKLRLEGEEGGEDNGNHSET